MTWRICHLVVGGLGLLLFILQGQYMARAIGVMDLPDAERMMYRSAHIYLLLSSLINVGVGYFMTPSFVLNYLHRIVGIVLLLSPALMLWSFISESTNVTLDRPIGRTGLYLLFGSGVLLHLSELYSRIKHRNRN